MGKRHSVRVRSIEMCIGSVGVEEAGRTVLAKATLRALAWLTRWGMLRELRLLYVDGGRSDQEAWQLWFSTVLESRWGGRGGDGERAVGWGEAKMKTDFLRRRLANAWGLEGGGGTSPVGRSFTSEDWEPETPAVISSTD